MGTISQQSKIYSRNARQFRTQNSVRYCVDGIKKKEIILSLQ